MSGCFSDLSMDWNTYSRAASEPTALQTEGVKKRNGGSRCVGGVEQQMPKPGTVVERMTGTKPHTPDIALLEHQRLQHRQLQQQQPFISRSQCTHLHLIAKSHDLDDDAAPPSNRCTSADSISA